MTLRLQWRRTWPDKPEDFACSGPDGPVGRIHSDSSPGGGAKRWFWTAHGYLPDLNIQLTDRGYAATKQEAAELVEAAYFSVRDAAKITRSGGKKSGDDARRSRT